MAKKIYKKIKIIESIHSAVSICGKHPFATGAFAIIGLVGLIFSIYSFSVDRGDTAASTQQISDVNNAVVSGLAETSTSIERIGTKIEQKNRANRSTYQDGTFLYEDKLEGVYSNFWTAYLLRHTPSPELTIRGEGKTIEFSGVISLNCESGGYYWETSSDFQNPLSESETKKVVPIQAIRAARRIFCWDKE